MNRRRRYNDGPVDAQTAELMRKASAPPLARITRWDLAFGLLVLGSFALDAIAGAQSTAPDTQLRDRSIFIEGYEKGQADSVDSYSDAPAAWDDSLARERSQGGN